jgi:hypothetical protein
VVFLRWKEKFHLLGAGRELLKKNLYNSAQKRNHSK